jgi:membrane protein
MSGEPAMSTEPAKLPRGSGWAAIVRAGHGFIRHRGIDAAAALTFFTLLATLPATLVLVSVFAVLDDRDRAIQDLVAIADTVLPDAAARDLEGVLRELLSLGNPGAALAIGTILLLWTVSGYATAFGRAMNVVYEVEEGRPFWVFRARMLVVAVVLVALAAGIVAVLLGTETAATDILGRRGLAPGAIVVWLIARVPLLLVLATLFVAVLYGFSPNVRHPRIRWLSAGSGFAIGLWLLATLGFGGYVALSGHYGLLYGSLGGIVIALLWVYLSNTALVAGVELDAEFVRLRQLARGMPAEERVRLPWRDDRRARVLDRQRARDVASARRIRRRTVRDSSEGSGS